MNRTALECDGIGLVAIGDVETIARLLAHARELGVSHVCLLTDEGLMFVAAKGPWRLRAVKAAK